LIDGETGLDQAAERATVPGLQPSDSGPMSPGLFNSCHKTPACLDGKLMANDLEAGSESPEPASDLRKLVGDTGIEPVTSSVSTRSS
jgi:hypothetical protein